MFRKTIAAITIAAALIGGAGIATAETTDPGVIITDNDDNWGVRDYNPNENAYTYPGVENCPGDAVWVSWTVTGYDEDGNKIWDHVCMYD